MLASGGAHRSPWELTATMPEPPAGGDSLAKVPGGTQASGSPTPWREIVGLVRNRLIHGYDAMDMDALRPLVVLKNPRICTFRRQRLRNHVFSWRLTFKLVDG